MAAKKTTFKDLLKEFGTKALGILVASVESVNVINWIKNITNFKEKARKYAISGILSIAAITVVLLGIASCLAERVAALTIGMSQIIVGLVVIIIAAIYMKS